MFRSPIRYCPAIQYSCVNGCSNPMAQADNSDLKKLRIIHCFRSPVGGIFRHVRDLIHQQEAQGHEIGVICDSNSGGAYEDGMLQELEPYLNLGLLRLPMNRNIGPRDLQVMWKLFSQLKGLDIDVLHSHGAKGGAYARLIGSLLKRSQKRPVRLYCPHGGSIHYDQSTLSGKFLFSLERFLERFTDRLVFVSQYERDGFFSKGRNSPLPAFACSKRINIRRVPAGRYRNRYNRFYLHWYDARP